MFAHKKLSAWQDSMALATELYKQTTAFPRSELFGLTSQVKRASVSIPANISEGAARGKAKEFIRFLRISNGSLSELDTLITLAYQLGYVDEITFHSVQKDMRKICAQISGLIRSVEKKSGITKSQGNI